MKKRYLIPLSLVGILALTFAVGPKPDYPDFTGKVEALDLPFAEVEKYVAEQYQNIPNLKPDNAGYLLWADSIPARTEYSVVYLHGFSASPKEGDPIHEEFARRYGLNFYAPLIAGHGIDDKESFKNISPKDWIDSAKEAIAIGNIIGEKVIVLSCSTGGTLSAYLAAENPDLIWAQMTYSPNIDLDDPSSEMLTLPWGLPLAQQVTGSEYRKPNFPPSCYPFWTTEYRLEGIVALKELVEQTMTSETFNKIKQPLFVGIYYKNEEQKDHVISTDAVREFFAGVQTPEDKKTLHEFAEGGHVLLSSLQMSDLSEVRKETYRFAEEVLGLSPVAQ